MEEYALAKDIIEIKLQLEQLQKNIIVLNNNINTIATILTDKDKLNQDVKSRG